mgnify:CR=1 FL=1
MAGRDGQAGRDLREVQAHPLEPGRPAVDGLRAEDFTAEQRLGIMYWFSVLANFDASGPAVFARATIHAFEQHEEDPVRKCFFSITRTR